MADWSIAGKQVLMTGATEGIGLAAARELVQRGARLTIVARDAQKGADVAAQLDALAAASAAAAHGAGTPGTLSGDRASGRAADADVSRTLLLVADLASQRQVRRLAAEALERMPRIDVLVNNAGALFACRQLTEDGIERTWAVNHLAPFLLTNLLLERLAASAPARVITTSSDAHRGARVPFDDLGGERSYRRAGFERYGETKLANILFTAELARRLEGSGVTANCFHPGLVASGFNRNNGALMRLVMTLARPFSRTPERGARTLVWLAAASAAGAENGGYFVDERRARPSAAASDLESARRLWELSEAQTGAGEPAAAAGS